ncbi:MAG TPA: DNA/RNA non-specific endonuclease, partial [Gemmatirosa sp.]|nr:DNA/RNA non-specific endonuclease [Gemmatirosa sp.]
PTAAPSNTLAVLRRDGGRTDTGDNAADFVTGAPNPRNSGGQSATPLTIAAGTSTLVVGASTTLTATLTLNNAVVIPASVTWAAVPTGVVTLDPTAGATITATGITQGTTTVTATASYQGQTYTATTVLTVNPAPTSLFLEGYSFRGTTPLPTGFQELYRVKTAQNATVFVRSAFRWTTSDAAVATVDSLGNVTGVWNGTENRTVTITAEDTATGSATRGRTGSVTLSVRRFEWSDTTGVYANPLQFGAPTGAALAGNPLVQRVTFAASWSSALGQPMWVAYNLDGTHRGPAADRCDCFTPDPLLPATAKVVTTADYDGTGYSRGHMTMSADRTRGELDNATTFYFSNIIPQTNQNNGGPWLGLEQALGDSARLGNREIYIFAGGAQYSGWLASANPSLAGAQRVAIPTWTWKVALLLENGRGVADVRTPADARLIAVAMPNTTTIPQVQAQWPQYRASVDSIEALTGFRFFSALPAEVADVFRAVPAGAQPVGMDVQPARVSLESTPTVNVIVHSGAFFDATAVNAADVRLVFGGAQVAPVSRGGVVTTSVRDYNDDGRPDRLVSFSVAALRAAGLAAGRADLSLRLAGAGAPAWLALDGTPTTIAP